jgi:hypothetical protein
VQLKGKHESVRNAGIIRKSPFFFLIALCSFWSYSSGQTLTREDVFNPKGWKLPGKELFDLSKVEKVSLPGVPREIIAEIWFSRNDSANRSTNLPHDPCDEYKLENEHLIDHVNRLIIYKTTDGRIICSYCDRELRAENPDLGALGCALVNLVCDLDGNGSNESQFSVAKGDSEYPELLASIARIKLGLSDESWLMSKLLKSTLRQIK